MGLSIILVKVLFYYIEYFSDKKFSSTQIKKTPGSGSTKLMSIYSYLESTPETPGPSQHYRTEAFKEFSAKKIVHNRFSERSSSDFAITLQILLMTLLILNRTPTHVKL